jgi:hypothetical protein
MALQPQLKVKFDPSNKNHRKMFSEFITNGNKWGGNNIFILEEEYGSVPDMIKDKMIRYYTGREFKVAA